MIKVSAMLGSIFLNIFNFSPLFQDNIGPTPITKIAGSIIGTAVELKKGSPTEILLLVKASNNNG